MWAYQADSLWLVSSRNIHTVDAITNQRQTSLAYCFTPFRDRVTKNDTIGTTFLNLSQIASSGGEVEGNDRITECYIQRYKPVFHKVLSCTTTDQRAVLASHSRILASLSLLAQYINQSGAQTASSINSAETVNSLLTNGWYLNNTSHFSHQYE